MIRPLNTILERIMIRTHRIVTMRERNIDQRVIDFEVSVTNDLQRQYVDRTTRLMGYMGVSL